MEQPAKSIAIIASDECKISLPEGRVKSWFHLRAFVSQHYDLLKSFKIFSTDNTAAIIQETMHTMRSRGAASHLNVKRIGPGARGVSCLAAMVAEEEVDRVLFFEDPRDLEMDRPENYALLRNCDLHGKRLCINEAAELWAQYEERRALRAVDRAPFISRKETVALIAHDGEKERMALFTHRHHYLLRRFRRIVATSGTKAYVERFLAKTLSESDLSQIMIQRLGKRGGKGMKGHGPAGGDVIIANEICRTYAAFSDEERMKLPGPLYHILFFMDHRHSQPHEPDIRVLLRTCVNPELRVNLILNSRMAEEWISRYERREPTDALTKPKRTRGLKVRAADPWSFNPAKIRATL